MTAIELLKIMGGTIAVGLSIYGHIPYIRDILANKTKSHIYTWLIWTVLTFISFFCASSRQCWTRVMDYWDNGGTCTGNFCHEYKKRNTRYCPQQ